MHSATQKNMLKTFVPLVLLLLVLLVWAFSRGPEYFNRQLKNQPGTANLLRAWSRGDYEEVLRLAETALAQDPMNPHGLIFSGFAAYYQGISQVSASDVKDYLDRTVVNLRKALILENVPQKKLIYYVLGKCYLEKGRYYADLAVRYLEMAMNAGYVNLDSYEYLGEAWSLLGNYTKSIQAYESALREFQSDRLYLKMAEDCYQHGDYEKSVYYYQSLIKRTSDEALKKKGLFHLGKLYYNIKNMPEAEITFQKVLEMDPAEAEACFLLGEINFAKKNGKKAREYWHKTLRMDPEHRNAKLRLYG